MRVNIESWLYHTLAELIADQSFADGICVNLCVTEYLVSNGMVSTDDIAGDHYVTLCDLQDVADTFCAGLDVINY